MAEDFFGNLSKTLKKTVDTVGKKTDEFVEIQKIRTRQHALEDQIEKNYQDIGLIIYNRYLNGEAFDENLAGICKDITDLEKEIADCKEDVANKRGRIVCPACGLKKKQRYRKRNDLDPAAGSGFPCRRMPEKEGRRGVKGK